MEAEVEAFEELSRSFCQDFSLEAWDQKSREVQLKERQLKEALKAKKSEVSNSVWYMGCCNWFSIPSAYLLNVLFL